MDELDKLLNKKTDKKRALISQRFFKTGKGEYGEGDIFLGIPTPQLREIAKQFFNISIENIQSLLNSKIHAKRVIGLVILINKYKKADDKQKQKIFDFYLRNTSRVNSWDLVDLSAPKIVGEFLLNKDKRILYELANSENLWERRIAIISTFKFIQENKFEDSLKISRKLLKDKHDLIHKAVGWMLREIGKKDQNTEEKFLKENYENIPRTTLRYAIERFEEEKRKSYLSGKI